MADYNIPTWTPDPRASINNPHPEQFAETKGCVTARYKNRNGKVVVKFLRFGNWDHPHGESYAADFYQRHSQAIALGRKNPRYWEYYYLYKGIPDWHPGDARLCGQMHKSYTSKTFTP